MLEAILEGVIGLVLRLPGYLLLKYVFRQPETDPEGCAVLLVGLLFWAGVGLSIVLAFQLVLRL
jgi:hypothetical protein